MAQSRIECNHCSGSQSTCSRDIWTNKEQTEGIQSLWHVYLLASRLHQLKVVLWQLRYKSRFALIVHNETHV